jgi:aryl-alcohol dehydrogenase-like predicted oxidoreductase
MIVSKLGMGFNEATKQIGEDETDPALVEATIDASLKRLQRDHIDVMLLHLNSLSVSEARPIFTAMEASRQAGKIRAYGWSTDFPQSVEAMADLPGFTCVEHAMSVFCDVPTIQHVTRNHDLLALIRSPLAMGVLTGKYDAGSKMPSDDIRATNDEWKGYFHDGQIVPEYLQRVAAVRELLMTGGRTMAQGALCWLLAKAAHNCPVPGAKTVAQVQDNAGAIALGPLPDGVMAEIEAMLQRGPEEPPRKR